MLESGCQTHVREDVGRGYNPGGKIECSSTIKVYIDTEESKISFSVFTVFVITLL